MPATPQNSPRSSAPSSRAATSAAAATSPSGLPAPRPRRRVWSDTQIAEMTEGTMPDARIQEAMHARDSRGMDPTSYAVLRTARRTESLTALLTLLDPPEVREQTQIDQVLRLLEGIAEAQIRTEARMVAIESRLAGWPAISPPLPGTGATRSRG